MATGDTKWVITMHPQLAKYFHQVYYLVIDYTFKQVKGQIDEWEIVGFVEQFKHHKLSDNLSKRISIATLELRSFGGELCKRTWLQL